MKVKHTKLKKSIFLILICISLTTTFVVSASAAVDPGYVVSLCTIGSSFDQCYKFDFHYFDSGNMQNYGQGFHSYFVPLDFPDEVLAGKWIFYLYFGSEVSFGEDFFQSEYYSFFPLFLDNPVSYAYISTFFGSETLIFDYQPLSLGGYELLYFEFYYPFMFPADYSIDLYFENDVSFTDSVGSGLTSSLSWVGQVVESLTTGPIKPLLECFAVTISVSALLLGIYSIRRFIWGS